MNRAERLQTLHRTLSHLAAIPDEQWSFLQTHLEDVRLEPGDVLVKQGGPADKLYFVLEGLVKTCFELPPDKLITKMFAWENRMVAPYTSILTGQPANLTVIALEPSTLLSLRADVLFHLYDSHQCWERLGRKFAEALVMEREVRQFQMMVLDAEARYEEFLKTFAPIANRVPQYEIADYLGITPVTLSNIRRRRLKKNQP